MSPRSDIQTSTVAIVGLISATLIFALVVLLQVVYYQLEASQQYAKDISQEPAELSDLVSKQQATLAGYGWIDQQKKIVAIPIQRAMQLVVAELFAPAGAAKQTPAPQQSTEPQAPSSAGPQEDSHAK